MIKTILLLSTLIFANYANTQSLTCDWIESKNTAANFYRPAQFQISINQSSATISNDSYFSRRYQPCWTGNFSSCYFAFGIDPDGDLKVVEVNETELTLEQSPYFTATINLKFKRSFLDLQKFESIEMVMVGDDGDGVKINGDKFICRASQ